MSDIIQQYADKLRASEYAELLKCVKEAREEGSESLTETARFYIYECLKPRYPVEVLEPLLTGSEEIIRENLFLLSSLAQMTLPHTEYENGGVPWSRTNNRDTLTWASSSGKIPYGKYARLIMYYTCAQAVRTKNPLVDFGTTKRHLMADMGIAYSSKGWDMLQEQVHRLITSFLTIETSEELLGQKYKYGFKNVRLFSEGEFWGDKSGTEGGWVRFSDEFFQSLIEHAAPLDRSVILAISNEKGRGNCLALDIYTFLNYRTSVGKQNSFVISWEQLVGQMGAEYKSIRDFRARFKNALDIVQQHTNFKVFPNATGLLIFKQPKLSLN